MNPNERTPWTSDGTKVLDADGVVMGMTAPQQSGLDLPMDVIRAASIAACWNICHTPLADIVRQRDDLLATMKDIEEAATDMDSGKVMALSTNAILNCEASMKGAK